MNLALPEDWPKPLIGLCALLAPGGSPAALDLSDAEWEHFADIAIQRHRVAPSITGKLEAAGAPEHVRQLAAHEAEASNWQALLQMTLTKQIIEAYDRLGITPVLLKGWPLAQQLYGSPGARHARDLDVLVRPDQVPAAAEVLIQMGFKATAPYRLRQRLIGSRALTQECYDIEFQHEAEDFRVELHWRTAHFPGWPDLGSRPEMSENLETEIGAIRVPTEAANLIYLSTHGGMHLWSRLKWLLDIAHLATRRGAEALEADLALAREMSAAGAVTLALRLSARLFGTPLPPGAFAPKPKIARLERQIINVLADPGAVPGTVRYKALAHMAALRLAETPAQWAGVLRYATWRRLRLGAAGLRGAVAGPGERGTG